MSVSNRKRWIVPWKDSRTKPAIYHCLSRVVDRRFAFEVDEREHFRMLMRMCEKFTGCRVLSYCIMSNHFHILLEVPPIPEDGISDEELFQRLGVFYSEAQVAEIVKQMVEAATPRRRGEFEMAPVDENGMPLTKAQEMLRLPSHPWAPLGRTGSGSKGWAVAGSWQTGSARGVAVRIFKPTLASRCSALSESRPADSGAAWARVSGCKSRARRAR